MKKTIGTMISLVYLLTYVLEPAYGQVLRAEVRESEKNAKVNATTFSDNKEVLNLLQNFSQANNGNSFQSLAGNANLPVTLSVNPTTLKLVFSNEIVKILSKPVSTLNFGLMLTNDNAYNPLNRLFVDKDLALNIPYIQVLTGEDGKKYYRLNMGHNQYSFEVKQDENGNKVGGFYYTKLEKAKLIFLDDKRIQLIEEDGSHYFFEESNQWNFLYPATAIVNNTGDRISFQYTPDGGVEILNHDNEVMVQVLKMPSEVMITYLNPLGELQEFHIVNENRERVKLINPLNQTLSLNYQDETTLVDVLFPTGAIYHFDYAKLSQVSYVIDGLTTPILYNNSYVSQFVKKLGNRYSEDGVYHYSVSQDGHNFAGNGIWCSKQIFESLNPLQDWMLECGSEHQNGVYGYTTWIESKVPVFSGKGIDWQQMVMKNSYNYLHLSTGMSLDVGDKRLTEQKLIYPESIKKAKSFSDLSDIYNKPIEVNYLTYDEIGKDVLPRQMIGQYRYYVKEDVGSGAYLGAMKEAIDGYGNQIELEYYPEIETGTYSLIKSQRMYRYGSQDEAKMDSLGLSWLESSVKVKDKAYRVKMPYMSETISSLNGQKTNGNRISLDIDKNSVLYGKIKAATELIQGSNPYIKKELVMNKTEDGNYEVYTIQTSAEDDTKDLAPTRVESEHRIYNRYGGLIKVVNPLNNDVLIYDNYDALGRVTQITYLPSNQAQYKQVYRYKYMINNNPNEAGYVLTTTVVTPTTGNIGYSTRTYYDQENRVVKVETQAIDRSFYYVTAESHYNSAGQLSTEVQYYYDEEGKSHPQVSRYFYNAEGELVVIQQADGKSVVNLNDGYREQKISYILEPTEELMPVVNGVQELSLCFDPLKSPEFKIGSDISAWQPLYTRCKVRTVSISQSIVSNISNDTKRPIWKYQGQDEYSIVLNKDFKYTNESGLRVPLYKNKEIYALVEKLSNEALNGVALDRKNLIELSEQVRRDCLSGNCQALSFNTTRLNDLQLPEKQRDLVNGWAVEYIYDTKDQTKLIAEVKLYKNNNHEEQALSTTYYDYDNYGHVIKVKVAKGGYNSEIAAGRQSNDVYHIGERTYTSLGYLLSSTSLINEIGQNSTFGYDKLTGLPIWMKDAEGNGIKIYYENEIWKLRPSKVVYEGKIFEDGFVIYYSYNANGDIAKIRKDDHLGHLISEISYDYHTVTLELTNIKMSYPDGSMRKLTFNYNGYETLVQKTYNKEDGFIWQQSYKSNHLGLPIKVTYSGQVNSTIMVDYQTDLLERAVSYNDKVGRIFNYDSLGRLIGIDNVLNAIKMRSYAYDYNRLGQKAQRTSWTEDDESSNLVKTVQRYDYTPLGQLSVFSCEGAECPKAQGNIISKEQYSYDDVLNKLLEVKREFGDSNTDITRYFYANPDPTQVSKVESQTITTLLQYDKNGNVIAMDKEKKDGTKEAHTLRYDAAQNLIELKTDSKVIRYVYDMFGRQIEESVTDVKAKTDKKQVNYYLSGLMEQKIGVDSRYYVGDGSLYKGEYERVITDGFNITGNVKNNVIEGNFVYTPFGEQTDSQIASLYQAQQLALSVQKSNLGYRMINTDRETNWQFLGEGYRAYNPELRVFMKHDSWSPWGSGGVNGYSYAGNDPINAFDPTGHVTEGDQKKITTAIDLFISTWQAAAIVGGLSLVIGTIIAFIPGVNLIAGLIIGFVAEVAVGFLATWGLMGWGVAKDQVGAFIGAAFLNAAIGFTFIAGALLLSRLYFVVKYIPKGNRMAAFRSIKKLPSNKVIKAKGLEVESKLKNDIGSLLERDPTTVQGTMIDNVNQGRQSIIRQNSVRQSQSLKVNEGEVMNEKVTNQEYEKLRIFPEDSMEDALHKISNVGDKMSKLKGHGFLGEGESALSKQLADINEDNISILLTESSKNQRFGMFWRVKFKDINSDYKFSTGATIQNIQNDLPIKLGGEGRCAAMICSKIRGHIDDYLEQ